MPNRAAIGTEAKQFKHFYYILKLKGNTLTISNFLTGIRKRPELRGVLPRNTHISNIVIASTSCSSLCTALCGENKQ